VVVHLARRGFHRLAGTLFQFGAQRLQLAFVIGAALLAIGILLKPATAEGIVLVSLGTAILASLLVAAIALERDEFLEGVLALGVQDVFSDRRDFTNRFWTHLVNRTDKHLRILGVANAGYARNTEIRDETMDAIRRAIVNRDVDVEILWLDPRHPLATLREEEEDIRSTRDDTIKSIEFFWSIKEQLPEPKRDRLVMKLHSAMPTCGITWSDDLLVVTHYLARRLNLDSPGFCLGPSLSLVDRLASRLRVSDVGPPKMTHVYMSNYRQIAEDATSVTADEYAALSSLRGNMPDEGSARRSEAVIRGEVDPA
jgi:hypothetical protein